MADDRKYRGDEIRDIFDLATSGADAGRSPASDQAGLTLAELQEVGLEVGVEPGRIATAALVLDSRRAVISRGSGGALALNRAGIAALFTGLILLTMFLTAGPSPVGMEIVMFLLVALGGGALIANLVGLPRWAREREGQMEYLAGRVETLLGPPAP